MTTLDILTAEAEEYINGATDEPDAAFLAGACEQLQENNRKLKDFIASEDAKAAYEAMNGGFLGLGCNDRKLIAALCTRTKSQLRRTQAKYRELYDKDLRKSVVSETGGYYGKLLKYALSGPGEYEADIIELACKGYGASETTLVELMTTRTHEQLQAGKKAWEGRNDGSLIDYLDKELTSSYDDLQQLLFNLLRGRRDTSDAVDEELAKAQIQLLHAECSKGMFADFKEDVAIEIIGKNNTAQNMRVAELYELTYDKSLPKALERSKKPKFNMALCALLAPPEDFLATRLQAAMKGWGTDKLVLVRLLSGIEGEAMVKVCDAYERKYGKPLSAALKDELSGDFERAAVAWVAAMADPAAGLEAKTEQDIEAIGEDGSALLEMAKALLAEYHALQRFLVGLDAETIYEACRGFGTDNKRLIQTLCSRNKVHLQRVSKRLWEAHDVGLPELIAAECSGRYLRLASYLVLPEAEADAKFLDDALDGVGCDKLSLCIFFFNRYPARVRAAKASWEAKHDSSLLDRLVSELSGDFEGLVLKMLRGKRMTPDADDDAVDEALAKEQAAALHEAQGDLELYTTTLCNNSPAQNRATAAAYEEAYDTSLQRAIDRGFSGYVRMALAMLLVSGIDATNYAACLRQSFKGWGAKHRLIIRILGTLDKQDALAVAAAYERKYQTPLRDSLRKECSGRYKKLAIAWTGVPDALENLNAPVDGPEDEAGDPQEDDADVDDEPAANGEDEPEPEPEPEVEPEPPEPPAAMTAVGRFFTNAHFKDKVSISEDGVQATIRKRACAFLGDSFGNRDRKYRLRLIDTASRTPIYCYVGATPPTAARSIELGLGYGFAADGTLREEGRKVKSDDPARSYKVGDDLELVYKHEARSLSLYVNGALRNHTFPVNGYMCPCVSGFTTSKPGYTWELLPGAVDVE